jgi:hypothetical protein
MKTLTPDVKTRGRIATWFLHGGLVLRIAGALVVLIGSLLPWAKLTAFGVNLSLTGAAGWGAVTMAMGLAALVRPRALPLLGVALGLACLLIGGQAQRSTGRKVLQFVFLIETRLAPVNDKLARVALPPIEPFEGAGPAGRYLGPGPLWTAWGGAALALGSAIQYAGGRLRRTCASCGTLWPADRAINYCPRCGAFASAIPLCSACHRPLWKNDRYCVHCGTAVDR